jgi:hypothetical protein
MVGRMRLWSRVPRALALVAVAIVLATCGSGSSKDESEGTCGNGTIEGPAEARAATCESCDGRDLGGKNCAGFGGVGDLRCSSACRVDLGACDGIVGNGRLEDAELCDVDSITGTIAIREGLTCASRGLGAGTLGCSIAPGTLDMRGGFRIVTFSRLDFSGCSGFVEGAHRCGDGFRDRFEECDGTDFGGVDCARLGLPGTLECDRASCIVTGSSCGSGTGACGNGIVDEGEECDGRHLGPVQDESDVETLFSTCFLNARDQGIAVCTDDCRVDREKCVVLAHQRSCPLL